jgi:uncharacterized protein with HEPN domain
MPSEKVAAVLEDMLRQIDLASSFLAGSTEEAFLTDLRTVYAVTRCLEIISEASRRLSGDLKERHPSIPWKNIAGAGNIYRHDYEDVSARQVWATVHLALPALRAVVVQELLRPR